ncbi:MAG: helix-turn-helix domain-containing protein [Ignavibacteria bacterium]|nr:helix-turn-helix domain-containing protein [Ignavibacteria bacterium]
MTKFDRTIKNSKMTTNSILLENISTDELKTLIAESVRAELSKIPKIPEQTTEVEKPISQPEAIQFLGKSRQTLITWRKRGIITGHTLGGRVYFLKSELLQALQSKN